jgi:hypothetical protein
VKEFCRLSVPPVRVFVILAVVIAACNPSTATPIDTETQGVYKNPFSRWHNRRLTARPDAARTTIASPLSIAVTANDDAPGARVSATTTPAYGTATISDSEITYTPRAGFVGMDSFVYTLTRGSASASARVEVTVACAGVRNPEVSYERQKSSLHVSRYGIRTTNPGTFATAIGYLDFDGDGLTDVFIAGGNGSPSTTPVELYRNVGADMFRLDDAPLGTPPPGLVHPRKALISDLDGDAKPDIFVAAHGYDQPPFAGEAPLALLSRGGYHVPAGLAAFSGYHHGGATADIDGDGDIDVFLTTDSSGRSFFLINDGNGNFTLDNTRLSSDLYPHQYYTAELLDIDGDCHLDLLMSGHEFDDAPTRILWGDGSGTFDSARQTILPAVDGEGVCIDLDAEDLDGDGNRDIVVTRTTPGYTGYYLQAIKNHGSRTFTDVTSDWLPTGQDANGHWIDWIHLQDADGDGKIDIVVDDAATGLAWKNDGSGHFTRQSL